MASLGFGLPVDTFHEAIEGGSHYLAPTASDMLKNKPGSIFAGLHYDFNFFTLHGKSNFSGLYIWQKNGEKLKVSIPDDCLLLQSGLQFQMLTNGKVLSGMHEVVYDQDAWKKKEELVAEGWEDVWRISSTVFIHCY